MAVLSKSSPWPDRGLVLLVCGVGLVGVAWQTTVGWTKATEYEMPMLILAFVFIVVGVLVMVTPFIRWLFTWGSNQPERVPMNDAFHTLKLEPAADPIGGDDSKVLIRIRYQNHGNYPVYYRPLRAEVQVAEFNDSKRCSSEILTLRPHAGQDVQRLGGFVVQRTDVQKSGITLLVSCAYWPRDESTAHLIGTRVTYGYLEASDPGFFYFSQHNQHEYRLAIHLTRVERLRSWTRRNIPGATRVLKPMDFGRTLNREAALSESLTIGGTQPPLPSLESDPSTTGAS